MSAARSWTYLLLCNLMWALQFTCVKLVQDQVGSFFTVWAPMTLATLLLWPLVVRRTNAPGRAAGHRLSDVGLFLVLAVVGVFPGQFFVTWGTRLSPASNAALLTLTLPICTAVMAHAFLGERMNRIRWISFALALIGVVLCSGIDFGSVDLGPGYLAGNSLIFLGLLGSAFYNSYGKKVLQRYLPLEMLFWTYLAFFAIMTPLTLAAEPDVFRRIPDLTSKTWLGLALLTVFHSFLSMVLFLKALDDLDATQAALSNYLIALFGLPISALWLGERLTPVAVAGGVLVLASTLLITVWEEKSSRRPVEAPLEATRAGVRHG
jgi:drug/metabolite transporter (DMT)-like permease